MFFFWNYKLLVDAFISLLINIVQSKTFVVLFVTDTHWCNPQFRVKLQDTDEDDEQMCSFIIQLMQKDRRKMKNKGERLVYIGFVIYRVSLLFFVYVYLTIQ